MTIRSKKTDAQNQSVVSPEQSKVESDESVLHVDLESLYAKPASTKRNLEVILFSSKACSACNSVKPFLENWMRGIDAEFSEITIDPENTNDQTNQSFKTFKVAHVPTIVVKENSEEIARLTGYSGKRQLESFLVNSISGK